MSTINVLEVRFRNDDDQPWSYEVPTITYDHDPHDEWRPDVRRHSTIKQWEARVVTYVRKERHPGSEVPECDDDDDDAAALRSAHEAGAREVEEERDGYESDLKFIEGALGQLDNETIRECATRVARLAEAAVAWGRTNTDGMRESDTELAGAIVDFLAAVARDGKGEAAVTYQPREHAPQPVEGVSATPEPSDDEIAKMVDFVWRDMAAKLGSAAADAGSKRALYRRGFAVGYEAGTGDASRSSAAKDARGKDSVVTPFATPYEVSAFVDARNRREVIAYATTPEKARAVAEHLEKIDGLPFVQIRDVRVPTQQAQFINATRVAFLAHELRSVAAAERERCARVCESLLNEWGDRAARDAITEAARRIREGT